jgi:hypothetical protein
MKENAEKVPGSNLAVKSSLTVPNFTGVGYRVIDIPRLGVCYTPLYVDIGTQCTSTSLTALQY